MQDLIIRQKELISEIQKELSEIKLLLIGHLNNEEVCETTKEEGLLDSLRLITSAMEYSLCDIKSLKEAIKGNGGIR